MLRELFIKVWDLCGFSLLYSFFYFFLRFWYKKDYVQLKKIAIGHWKYFSGWFWMKNFWTLWEVLVSFSFFFFFSFRWMRYRSPLDDPVLNLRKMTGWIIWASESRPLDKILTDWGGGGTTMKNSGYVTSIVSFFGCV